MKFLSRFFSYLVAFIVFTLFFGFALKNTQEATLNFFFGYSTQASLVLMLLAFFAAGAALGILAMVPTLFRYRRDLIRARKAAADAQQEYEALQQARTQPPRPDQV